MGRRWKKRKYTEVCASELLVHASLMHSGDRSAVALATASVPALIGHCLDSTPLYVALHKNMEGPRGGGKRLR